MIQVMLKQRSDKTIDDWNNIRMVIELPGEPPQLFGMTLDQVIDLDQDLFDFIISDDNNIDREIEIAGTKVKLSPLMISAIHSKTSDYIYSWAITAFENDWLDTENPKNSN